MSLSRYLCSRGVLRLVGLKTLINLYTGGGSFLNLYCFYRFIIKVILMQWCNGNEYLPQTLTFNSHNLAIHSPRPLIFQTMNSVRSNSLKYQRFTPSGCEAIGVRKSQFVPKTQFGSCRNFKCILKMQKVKTFIKEYILLCKMIFFAIKKKLN